MSISANGAPPGIEASRGTVGQAVATASLNTVLFRDWTGSASLDYSSTHQHRIGIALNGDQAALSSVNSLNADFQLANVDVSATGEVFHLPGGMARLSAGLATRYETYRGTVPSITPLPMTSQSRAVRSAYGEVLFPLVDRSLGLGWAQSIDLSIAYRFDDYTDIGSAAKPKLGWSWVPLQGYRLKGTFGQSFEAPLLAQMYAPMTSYTTNLPTQTGPGDTLVVEGGTRGLSPEKSMTVTIGADIEPEILKGFTTSISSFYVKFRDRIQSQNVEAKSLQQQALLLSHAENVAGVPSLILPYYDIPGFQRDNAGLGAAGVQYFVDNRLNNAESTTLAGLTLDNRYRYRLSSGYVDLFMSALHILSDETQAISWVPRVNVAGTVGEPPKWKIAAGADWESTSFGLELRLNSISGAQNVLATPYESVSSFTTADMAFHYDYPDAAPLLLRGVTIALSVQNLSDRHPPSIRVPTDEAVIGRPMIPYDGTNASAVGRFIELSLRKRW